MADNNRKKPRINSELAMEIQRLMAEETGKQPNVNTEIPSQDAEQNNKADYVNNAANVGNTASVNGEAEDATAYYGKDGAGNSDVVGNSIHDGAGNDDVSGNTVYDAAEDSTDNDGAIKDGGNNTASDKESDTNGDDDASGTSDGDGTSDPVTGKSSKALKTILIVTGILLVLLIAGIVITYIYESKRYEEVFFENTFINNLDVSYKTPQEVKTIIKELCNDYEITVKARDRDDETVKATDVGLYYVTGEEIDNILAQQEPMRFYLEKDNIKQYEIPTMLKLDEMKLAETTGKLNSFDDDTVTDCVDARLGDYDPNTSEYLIIPEYDGNEITDKNKAMAYIGDAILGLRSEVNLEDIADEIYPTASIRSDNQALNNEKDNLDRFVKTKISYKDSDIVLDGNTIKNWLIIDENKNISLDEDKVRTYVSKLADHFDTVGKERKFTSVYGNETKVSGGTFGWLVDQEAEFNELMTQIPECSIIEKEPVYSKRGIVHGDSDWGDTYVEVNLAKQHLFFIKNGELVTETDVVSGGLQRKAGTPTGVYAINYKSRNAILRGPRRADGSYEYESPVSYWMPFNKGIGLHDASWRGSFGGNIYKYSGSHGCVNLPKSKAKVIFENIEVGVPVIVYDDDFVIVKPKEETETEAETKAKKKTSTKKQTQPATEAATQAVTETEALPETQPVTQGEIGPGVSGIQTQQEAGPGVTTETEAEITTNAENLPGEMQ